MIGPVSETGKTMLASLQGAMSRGMPVDQAITYVKSMAQQGVAPLVDLYSLLKQFERLKQPPVQTAQGGNLKEQLNSLEAGIVAGQRSMSPLGIPMGRGLGGLNAGRMENPQFAGGGIVAFDKGGQAKSITPELYTVLPKTYEELARERMREAEEIKSVEGRAAYLKRKEEEDKALGLGQYKESLKLGEERAKRLGEKAKLLPEELAALDEEAFWGDVATADPRLDVIGAMAASKGKATERKRTRKEKVSAAEEKAELEKIARQEAREALKEGDIAKYNEKTKEAKTLSEASVKDFVGEQEKEAAAVRASERARKNAIAQAKAQRGPKDELLRKLQETPEFLDDGSPNPEFQRTLRLYNIAEGKGDAQLVTFFSTVYEEAERAYRDALENHGSYGTKETETILNNAKAARDKALQEYRAAVSRAGLPSSGAGSTPAAGGEVPELPSPDFELDQ